ncbi:MAG: DUF5615 family PIN-like protein [Flavobacteriales bacterium]|jgi:predicted nuclease of predicted toxin-antitoxin system|nr:DUF5615 family PIN-like protein [Flavobacteriales bacterium]
MRFLANENFPEPSIAILRAAGHDVSSIRTEHQGEKDPFVIAKAQQAQRTILTFDKDYGEIIFKNGVVDPPAVVFFRYRGKDPTAAAHMLLDLLAKDVAVENTFTVLESDGLRQRKY